MTNEVPATEEDYELLLACAKGHRQRAFLEELIFLGLVKSETEIVKGYLQTVYYGSARLPGASFAKLKQRVHETSDFRIDGKWKNGSRTLRLKYVGS